MSVWQSKKTALDFEWQERQIPNDGLHQVFVISSSIRNSLPRLKGEKGEKRPGTDDGDDEVADPIAKRSRGEGERGPGPK